MYMFDRFDLVSTNQYQKISQRCESILKMGESVCIIFPYLSDRQFRIKQYIDSFKEDNIIPIAINPEVQLIDDFEEFKHLINQQLPIEIKKENLEESLIDKKITVVLMITNGELLLKPENESIMDILQNISLSFLNVKILTTFEVNIFKAVPEFKKYSLLFQNIVYYPLYKDEDVMIFIDYLCKKWEIKMPQPVRKTITYNSGGFFWLIKEACRIYRDTGDWSTESQSWQLRLNSIFKSLSEKEKIIIEACPNLKSFENDLDLDHLKKIGLIRENNLVAVPELIKVISNNKNREKIFEIDNEEIMLRGVSLLRMLSATEYLLLKYFITRPNVAITRDEIAKILWPIKTEDNYSQWAIDQAVKRLRDRLVSLRLSPSIVKSIRGVGYEFRA